MRAVDHKKTFFDTPGYILRIEYDPMRSSPISSVHYANGIFSYTPHTVGLSIGARIIAYIDFRSIFVNTLTVRFNNGDSCSLAAIPHGSVISDVERYPGSGGVVARSAGTHCLLPKKYNKIRKCLLRLPSGDLLSFSHFSTGTKGVVSNETYYREKHGRAGRVRLRGRKPIVRGVAKNPVDHPHGGGEGKKSKKCFPRTA